MSKKRKKLLLFTDWFEPGYKAGGPIRSTVNFVKHLQNDFEIFVFTSDRDLNATHPYTDVPVNTWIPYEKQAKVYYCSTSTLRWKKIDQVIGEIAPDFIYLNSLFSKYFTIYPLLMMQRRGWSSKIVLAPRGMLRESALRFKPFKKKLYLKIFKTLSLHKKIAFQATDETESRDIEKYFSNSEAMVMAPNFPGFVPDYSQVPPKRPGELNMIFIGRLHPIKNLDYLLQLLPQVSARALSLTIIGSEEDKSFVERCRTIALSFPAHIRVHFAGEIPNERIPELISGQHILALPTRGENFGHAIFEALAAGRPVLISDQTPWRNLAMQQAGWDLPLEAPGQFVTALQQAIDFGQEEFNQWSKAAWNFVKDITNNNDLKTTYLKLFS